MADSNYISEHSGETIDTGVAKGLVSVQEVIVGNITQPKDANGNVTLPAYPTTLSWGSLTGTLSSQADLNTSLNSKLDKNAGTSNVGKFAVVDANGNYTPTENPLNAYWGRITGTLSSQTDLKNTLDGKVDVVAGKQLTTNDYNNTEKAQVAKVATIEGLIPSEATTTNQLADKDYVDNKVAINSGTYKGSFSTVADLPSSGNNNNDYANVLLYSPTTGETIGFARYKWVTAENQWKWEYDNITNSFTPAQNAAIDSGITNAKVTSYDNHISDTNNPHSVTAAQLNLDQVVNTGDSATPVKDGTTKFTTGGAYTELNKKVDKTITVGGVALSQNVTNQNLFDAIKDIEGILTHKAINGPDNTITNVALTSLANQGTTNAGKPIVVGNDGVVTIGDNTPTYINISNTVRDNAYNSSNGSFNHCKFVLQNDMVFYNIDYQLNTPILDKQAEIRKVMELPVLGGQFSYPSKINVRLTQTVGQPTCQGDAYAYYNPSGEAYINPTTYQTLQVIFTPIVLYVAGESFTNANGEPIYLGTQNTTPAGAVIFEGARPIITHDTAQVSSVDKLQYDWDVCYYTEGTGTAPSSGYYHNSSTNKWYLDGAEISVTVASSAMLAPTSSDVDKYVYGTYGFGTTQKVVGLYKGIEGHAFYIPYLSDTSKYGGCEFIAQYYNRSGTKVTGSFWKLRKIIARADADYMYKGKLCDVGCRVNDQGVWGHWEINSNEINSFITFSNVYTQNPINHGICGTATFVPEPQNSASDLFTLGNVINNTLYIPGQYAIDRIQIGAGGIM